MSALEALAMMAVTILTIVSIGAFIAAGLQRRSV